MEALCLKEVASYWRSAAWILHIGYCKGLMDQGAENWVLSENTVNDGENHGPLKK